MARNGTTQHKPHGREQLAAYASHRRNKPRTWQHDKRQPGQPTTDDAPELHQYKQVPKRILSPGELSDIQRKANNPKKPFIPDKLKLLYFGNPESNKRNPYPLM